MSLHPQLLHAVRVEAERLFDIMADDFDIEAFVATLDGVTDFEEIADRLLLEHDEWQSRAKVMRERAAEMAERARVCEDRASRVKSSLMRLMEAANVKRLPLAAGTVSLASSPQKLVGEADPSKLPERFRRVKVEADKEAIKRAIRDGEVVDGYSLSNGEPTLRIGRAK